METYAGLMTVVAIAEAIYIFVQRRKLKHANDPVGTGGGGNPHSDREKV